MAFHYLKPFDPVDNHPLIKDAINRIYADYGDRVSVSAKNKSLNKFGQNADIGTAWETVHEFQGAEINETFVSTNLIDSVSSGSTGDTSKTITVEGHTIDGSGNLTFVSQDVTTDASNGQTEVTLSTPLARANRAFIKNSGTFNSPQTALAGILYVYDNTGGQASGVPSTASGTKLTLPIGFTQSEKAATSISSSDYWILTGFNAGVGDGTANAAQVTVRMETRDVFNGGVWRPLGNNIVLIVGTANPPLPKFTPYRIVPKNHDWRIRAICDANTAPIFAEAEGVLAAVQ